MFSFTGRPEALLDVIERPSQGGTCPGKLPGRRAAGGGSSRSTTTSGFCSEVLRTGGKIYISAGQGYDGRSWTSSCLLQACAAPPQPQQWGEPRVDTHRPDRLPTFALSLAGGAHSRD